MPDYGMELRNDSGNVIASASQLNFSLRSSGVIINSQFPSGEYYFCCAVLDTSEMNTPLVFLKPLDSNSRVSMLPGTGDDFLPQNWPQKKCWVITKWWNKTVSPIQYYIFDRWSPPVTERYGIRMWDASGSPTFDSNWYHLLLKNVIWLDPDFPNHNGHASGDTWTNIGALGAGNLAISMPLARFFGYRNYCLSECFHLTGADNQLYVSVVPRGEVTWFGYENRYLNRNMKSQVMVADVSRLPVNYNPVNVF